MSNSKEYMREYMARRYEERKQAAVEQLGGKCASCGSKDDLQFDHIDPTTKSFTICSKLAGVSKKRLQEELSKCQLLCSSCHEEKTLVDLYQERSKGIHGNALNYSNHGCRCRLCTDAHSARCRKYKNGER